MSRNQVMKLAMAAPLTLALYAQDLQATPLTTVLVTNQVNEPVYVTHAPCDFDRIFIVEQDGRIKVLDIGSSTPGVFLNITNRTGTGGERGLLGLAFHPDYASNGLFYVNYTNVGGDTVIAEYQVTADPDVADVSSERILLTIGQPFPNHNAGWMAFGPNDGYLYIATGDGGSGGDPGDRAQNINELLGKMLRIDVDSGIPYGIPPDNPFVGVTGADEIWAYGLRNPWRNAFDSGTGDLYIADVGQSDWEEINFQPASGTGGDNWGWRCREGAHNFNFIGDCGVPGTPSETLLDPIHEYSHGAPDFHCSITGGEVYRGCAVPDLRGSYFFADFCSNDIWSLENPGGPVVVTDRTTELAPGGALSITSISGFGRDAAGEIYICDLGGEVYKIVPDGVPDACATSVGAPKVAPHPHDRRKNRYISFDPNHDENKGINVAFRIELNAITLGSCDGNGGFCREDRKECSTSGDACTVDGDCPMGETCSVWSDCKVCDVDANPCINQPIDCAPVPEQSCVLTGDTCLNDAPDVGGPNVGSVWWVGPESPLGNSVHLAVTEPFRKVSDCWANPVHVGDCEITPEAVYGIRAVDVDAAVVSDELEVETTLFAPISSSWWADCVGPLKKYCSGDTREPECDNNGDCPGSKCERAWSLPDGSVNVDDLSAALVKFAPGPNSILPHVTWVDVHGNDSGVPASQNFDPPNFVTNVADLGQIIFGFQGRPYTFYDPADCPDEDEWP